MEFSNQITNLKGKSIQVHQVDKDILNMFNIKIMNLAKLFKNECNKKQKDLMLTMNIGIGCYFSFLPLFAT
jgi:hypothetical protein